MMKVGVARLKAELSRYLAAAKQGEEVLITERGRPVAKLVALRGADRAGSRRERLARAGVLMLGAGHLSTVRDRGQSWPIECGLHATAGGVCYRAIRDDGAARSRW